MKKETAILMGGLGPGEGTLEQAAQAKVHSGADRSSVPFAQIIGWMLCAALGSLMLARTSVWIQEAGFASMLLPIVLGGSVGAATIIGARFAEISSWRAKLVAAIACAFICIFAQHLFFYLDYRLHFLAAAQEDPTVGMFRAVGELEPASISQFFRASAAQSFGSLPRWQWWIIDAALTMLSATGAVLVWNRRSPRPRDTTPPSETGAQ